MVFLKRNLFVRTIVSAIREVFFELKCVIYDVKYTLINFKKNRNLLASGRVETILVCSIYFFQKKKWQVASQGEVWHSFESREDVLLCGSFISYFFYGRKISNIVSLEPKYSAPLIQFGNNHSKVIVFVSDSHSKKWLPDYIKKFNITDIITPYRKTLISTGFFKGIPVSKVHSFPWSVNGELINNNKLTTLNSDVLGFGKTGSEVYDLREWSFNSGELSSFDYAGSGNRQFVGKSFFDWLRSFDACVVAMSSNPLYNYTVAKFFEVPSQGLLLFVFPSEDLADFGFIDGENCIYVNKDNFFDKLKEFKSAPYDFLEIRRSGVELIKKNHTVSHRVKFITELLYSS